MNLRLQELRDEKGWTQSRVARTIDVSENCYNFWERRTRIPSLENIIKLADAFNVSIDYLVGRSSKGGVGDEQKFEDAP